MKQKKIAIFLFDIQDVSGGGGVERFWADVFRMYPKNSKDYKLYFFMDNDTYHALTKIKRLVSNDNIVFIINSRSSNSVLKNFSDSVNFIFKLLMYKIDILHCAFYGPHYYKRLKYLGLLPKFIRPKIVLTEVTSMTPYCYIDEKVEELFKLRKYFLDDFYNNIKIDGIFTWYQLTKKVLEENNIVKSKPIIYAVKHCFTDLSNFKPLQKENNVVFASRLVPLKHPEWFLQAVINLYKRNKELLKGWKFYLYGKGPMEKELHQEVINHNLQEILFISSSPTMNEILGKSKLFVSCQDYENFTSLVMLEAMACGNVIVSRNVGQTNYFAREGVNGFLAAEDTILGLTKALEKALLDREEHDVMATESIKIANDEHNIYNFMQELKEYWNAILKN